MTNPFISVGCTTGTIGRAYAATLFEASAITRLAKAANKTYGVGLVVMTHGETDCQSTTYHDELVQMINPANDGIHLSVLGYQMVGEKMHGSPLALPRSAFALGALPLPKSGSSSYLDI